MCCNNLVTIWQPSILPVCHILIPRTKAGAVTRKLNSNTSCMLSAPRKCSPDTKCTAARTQQCATATPHLLRIGWDGTCHTGTRRGLHDHRRPHADRMQQPLAEGAPPGHLKGSRAVPRRTSVGPPQRCRRDLPDLGASDLAYTTLSIKGALLRAAAAMHGETRALGTFGGQSPAAGCGPQRNPAAGRRHIAVHCHAAPQCVR